jgi:hypothetical protein
MSSETIKSANIIYIKKYSHIKGINIILYYDWTMILLYLNQTVYAMVLLFFCHQINNTYLLIFPTIHPSKITFELIFYLKIIICKGW